MRSPLALALVSCLASAGCGGPGNSAPPPQQGQQVITEQTPYGTRTTYITTVPAPGAPARGADPYPDPLAKYNVELLNSYRSQAGVAPLLYDAAISRYAYDGSSALAHDHQPHGHYMATDGRGPGLGGATAENQGDPRGIPPMDRDAVTNGQKQVAAIVKMMMDEGPGGGHHDNILNAGYRRVGVGFYYANGWLFLTNDFSN